MFVGDIFGLYGSVHFTLPPKLYIPAKPGSSLGKSKEGGKGGKRDGGDGREAEEGWTKRTRGRIDRCLYTSFVLLPAIAIDILTS